MGYMKLSPTITDKDTMTTATRWASRLAAELYSHLIDKGLIYDPEFAELKNAADYVRY